MSNNNSDFKTIVGLSVLGTVWYAGALVAADAYYNDGCHENRRFDLARLGRACETVYVKASKGIVRSTCF